MGVRELLGWSAEPVHERASVDAAISEAISQRQADFTMADALAMPSVARAVDLIVSIGSSMQLVEYSSGFAEPEQARFVRRPDPYLTRQEFVEQTLHAIIEEGEWFWRLGTKDDRGYPRFAMVLDNSEVDVQWDERRFQRIYTWRDRTLVHGIDILHGAVNRKAGELHGRSVLREALPYLATIDAAEQFAASAFGTNGIPLTVLMHATKMTKDEADTLKAQWATSRQANPYEPAVASGGVTPLFPAVDPQKMQMQEARAYGATVVARLLGIPAPLLHVETSGATTTYVNAEASLDALVKTTVLPRYLNPVEATISDAVPRTKAVKFSVAELNRADVETRYKVYAEAIAAGIILPDEARLNEGLPPNPPPLESVQKYEGQPARETDPSMVSAAEVPAP